MPAFNQKIESKLRICHVLHNMSTSHRFFTILIAAASCFLPPLGLAQNVSEAPVAPTAARKWVSPPPGNAQSGAALYQQHCTACHSVNAHLIGPAHRGVMGRRIGSAPGYKYSNELAASRLRWTPQTLFAWLGEPEDLVPGQRMGFSIESEQERGDLIAYLATLK